MSYVGGREQLNKDVEMLCSPIPDMERRLNEYRAMMSSEGFWQRDDAEQVSRDYGKLTDEWTELLTLREAMDFAELMEDESFNRIDDDDDLVNAWNEVEGLATELKHRKMLSGEYDDADAIITFHSGSGGDEANDWTDIMFRAVTRWCETRKWKVEITDFERGGIAGYSSLTMIVKGKKAYGYTQALNGVYRLVRISPFDAAGRRHTSFMSVEVMPMVEAGKVTIDTNDVVMETMIAHVHAGGQNVQHNNTAVRLIHKPTGIAVRYDAERSQMQNRMGAMRLLEAKLAEIARQEHEAKMNDLKGEQVENGWGNATVSVTLMPYQLAQDRRTGWESGNTTAFLDGELGDMVDKWLEQQAFGGKNG